MVWYGRFFDADRKINPSLNDTIHVVPTTARAFFCALVIHHHRGPRNETATSTPTLVLTMTKATPGTQESARESVFSPGNVATLTRAMPDSQESDRESVYSPGDVTLTKATNSGTGESARASVCSPGNVVTLTKATPGTQESDRESDCSLVVPCMRTKKWMQNYNDVLMIAQKYGKLYFPPGDPTARRLSSWLIKQKNRKDITHYEKQKLEELKKYGYDVMWRRDKVQFWQEMFDQYCRYTKETGRSVVPSTNPDYRQLSVWVANQRQSFKRGKLSSERYQHLKDVGFVFSKHAPHNKEKKFTKEQETKWNAMFQGLVDFKRANGHCNVPAGYKDCPKLSVWVRNQRREYFANVIDESRRLRLESIGFTWRSKTVSL